MNLFIEKNNRRFKQMTKSNQASGLSVCIDMIFLSLSGSRKETIDSFSQIELFIKVHNPKNLILTSIFLTEQEMKVLRKQFPKIRIYAMIHSNLPFFGAQSEVSQRIMECQNQGVKVIVNDERVSRAVRNTVWLPNIYKGQFEKPMQRKESDVLKILCSGSLRPMKNHITQALASIKYAEKKNKKLEFYINGDRNEGGVPVLVNLNSIFQHNKKHDLISIPWLDHSSFLKTIPNFDMGLQVSLSESFNIVAGDYTCKGLPMVVSHEINWASEQSKADCHDVDMIIEKMETCHNFTLENQKSLLAWSQMAVERWEAQMNS